MKTVLSENRRTPACKVGDSLRLNMVGRGNLFNSTLMGANLREPDVIRQTGCSHEAWGRRETVSLTVRQGFVKRKKGVRSVDRGVRACVCLNGELGVTKKKNPHPHKIGKLRQTL